MSFKIIASLLLAFAIYSSLTFYIGWNFKKLLQKFGFKKGAIFYWLTLYLIAYSMFLARFIHIDFLQVVGYYWMFFFIYGLMLSLVSNFLWFVTGRRHTKKIGIGALVVLALLFVFGTYYAFTPIVIHETIERHEKSDKKSLKIVVASDTHLGMLSNKKHLEKFVELANAEKPDIVLFAGDVVDDIPKWFIEQNMKDTMKKIEAKNGVYAVLGNHEYIGNEVEEVVQALEAGNVKVLTDQSTVIEDAITLTGRDDATNKERKTLAQLQNTIDIEKPWIVVDHQPSKTLKDPEVDIMLSGHTHAGQVWPGKLFTKMIYPLDYGHRNVNGTDYVVTSGYGFWGLPMRLGTQSELWSITVQFK